MTAEPLPDEPSIQIIQVDRKECRISKNGFFKPSEALSSQAKVKNFGGESREQETFSIVYQPNEESTEVGNPMYQKR